MLDQTDATPLYAQLMEELENNIKNGVYKPGERLMTENEMAKEYGVSLITVRKALGFLMEKGLVVRKRGKGTFVTKTKLSRNMKKLQSFSEMCRQLGVEPGAKMLENCLIQADAKVAARLGIQEGSQVVCISRLRFADGEPVAVEKNYFPVKFAFLLDYSFDDNSLIDFLREKSGIEISGSEKLIELCKATEEEAKLLDVEKGENLLFVKSTAFDSNDEPLYAGVQIINGENFSLYVYESNKV